MRGRGHSYPGVQLLAWKATEDRFQSWSKICRQIHEIKQKRFSYKIFYSSYFAIFLPKNFKIWLLRGRLRTRRKIQAFHGFS